MRPRRATTKGGSAARTRPSAVVLGLAAVAAGLGVGVASPACRGERRAPIYATDVAPLLARRCSSCHATPGIPPALDTADRAARSASAIVRAVERREMPPWGPDDTGLCGTFADAQWLAPDEIATLRAWAAAGAPAGDDVVDATLRGPMPPPAPPAASGTNEARDVRDVIVVVDPGADFAPGLGAAASRCFLVAPAARDVVVTSVAGSPTSALQLGLYVLPDDAALAAARREDDVDTAPGWPCPAAGPTDGRLAVAWSYATPTQRLPEGLPLPAGKHLVLHARADLVALGLNAVVRPRLELGVGAGAPGALVPVRSAPASQVAGRRRAEVTVEHKVAHPGRLLGVVPRLGPAVKTMEVAVVRGGSRACAAYFGHWRPTLEQLYRRREAMDLRADDVVQLTCAVNTVDGADAESACAADLYIAN